MKTTNPPLSSIVFLVFFLFFSSNFIDAEEVEMDLEESGSVLTNLRIVFDAIIEIITGVVEEILGVSS